MIRWVLAVAAGYIAIVVLNGFLRIIASVYTNTDLSLTGVAGLPSEVWQYGVTGLLLIFGMIGGLLTTTMSKTSGQLEIISLILLIVGVGFIDYRALENSEPMWYLITSPLLKIGGIYLGFRIKKLQDLTSTIENGP